MKKIEKISTVVLCLYLYCGLALVSTITICCVLRDCTSYSNRVISFFTQNAEIDFKNVMNKDDNSKNKYDYDDQYSFIQKYKTSIENYKSIVTELCKGAIPKSGLASSLARGYKTNILRINVTNEFDNYNYSFKAVQAINIVKRYCELNEIDFVYVQMPSSDRVKYINGEMTSDINDMINRSIIFQLEMDKQNIPFIDLCKDDKFCENIEFDLSNHWKTKYAFQAMKKVAQYLSDQYGIEMADYSDNNYYYLQEDDDSILIPKQNKEYVVSISEEKSIEGYFRNVLIRDIKDQNPSYPYSNSFVLDNNHFYSIKNKNSVNNKKILILGDSFSWPITTYLAESFSQTMALHPKYFDGAVTKYIELNKPDIVLMMYYEGQVGGDNNTAFSCIK